MIAKLPRPLDTIRSSVVRLLFTRIYSIRNAMRTVLEDGIRTGE
jgi:hypothetical protein